MSADDTQNGKTESSDGDCPELEDERTAIEDADDSCSNSGEECANENTGDGSTSEQEAELAAARDAALRAQADAVNTKRRADQEIEKARKFALERFCGDLLAVVDNLERAMESSDAATDSLALLEGVELTHKGFIGVLEKYGLEVVDPIGEPFDPETAQAISMVDEKHVEPNSVTSVMQKGYTLNGRLLRPAMVVVAKTSG